MENDFVDLCGITGHDCANWQNQGVTAENLMDAFKTHNMDHEITEEEALEMIFELEKVFFSL